jgi:cytochrome c oxidase subunit II
MTVNHGIVNRRGGRRVAMARRARRLSLVAVAVVWLAGCRADWGPANRRTPSALDVRGEGARLIADEWWFLFIAGSLIFLLVLSLLGFIIVRHRRNNRTLPEREVILNEPSRGLTWILVGGILLPIVVLSGVYGVTLRSLLGITDPDGEDTMVIEVIGHRWWWEVRYPDEGFVTANQIVIPIDERVRIDLSTRDVIHSFWVPQLQHKMDMIPGQDNSLWIQADYPGVYRGLCAEYCGLQHAHMQFILIAMPEERYDAWLANERGPAVVPMDDLTRLGQEVFLSSSCVYCHQIRGTPAAGMVGPDLTHIAGRITIAAGTLENNRGNMGGWISDPQHIKPGALMPADSFTGEELQALLAYLDSLN